MTTDRRTRTTPPTAQQLVAVIAGLPVPDRHVPARALHLAMPVTCVPGVDAGVDGDVWWYRDSSTLLGTHVEEVCHAVVALVVQEHRPGDEYLDLDGDPLAWCKPVLTRQHVVAYGADLLFHLPSIACSEGTDASLVLEVVRLVADESPIELPAVAMTSGGPVLIGGGEGWISVVVE